jgi:hypothetical protein
MHLDTNAHNTVTGNEEQVLTVHRNTKGIFLGALLGNSAIFRTFLELCAYRVGSVRYNWQNFTTPLLSKN